MSAGLIPRRGIIRDALSGGSEIVFEVIDELRGVVEYRLVDGLRFRLHNGKGQEYIASTELRAQRDISINDAQVLAIAFGRSTIREPRRCAAWHARFAWRLAAAT